MTAIRLKHDMTLAWGPTLRAGTKLYVLREFTVNRTAERRLCLGYEDGRIVLPSVPPEEVEWEHS